MAEKWEEMFSKIIENKDLMKKINEITSSNENTQEQMLGKVMDLIAPSVTDSEEKQKEPPSQTMSGQFRLGLSKNVKLLNALKPYLSKSRAEMIDKIVKISEIANVFHLVK